jgi:hypothetical protein
MESSEEDFSPGSWESLFGDEPEAGAGVYPFPLVSKKSFASFRSSQQEGEKEKHLMTREEQEARNEATEARVESMMGKCAPITMRQLERSKASKAQSNVTSRSNQPNGKPFAPSFAET